MKNHNYLKYAKRNFSLSLFKHAVRFVYLTLILTTTRVGVRSPSLGRKTEAECANHSAMDSLHDTEQREYIDRRCNSVVTRQKITYEL